MAKFTKGNKVSNGRPLASKNRTSKEMKERLSELLNLQIDNLQSDLDGMLPATRWITLVKLMAFIMPVMSKNDNRNTIKKPMEIIVEYVD